MRPWVTHALASPGTGFSRASVGSRAATRFGAALARALGCAEGWVGLATQDEGFGWRDLR